MHNDTLYGTKSLYCEYVIYNKDGIDTFTIQTSKNWGELTMKIKYFISTNENNIILSDGDQYTIKEAEEIKIIFKSDEQKNTLPFNIKIIDTYSTWRNIVFICIIIGIFIILIILLICFICWKKRRKRILYGYVQRNNLNQIYMNNINIVNSVNTNTDRIGLMNYLNGLKSIKFKEIKNDATETKCPIDMENFELDSDIILTKCFHIFHYECLKMYIEKNNYLKELKCPLCNCILYNNKNNI